MKNSRTAVLIQAAMLVFCIVLTIALTATDNAVSRSERALEGELMFGEGWTTADGKPLDSISRLDGAGGEIRKVLPAFEEGSALCFRGSHFYYSIEIDGETIYTQPLPEGLGDFYTNSPGAVWAWVPLNTAYSGKTLSVKYTPCYPSGVGISDIRICRAEGFVLRKIEENMLAIATSFVYIIIALILIVADIPINYSKTKNHEMLYLGLVSLAIGFYVFCESYGVQMFTGNEKIMHMYACMSLMLVPIPTVLYSAEAFGYLPKRLPFIFSIACAGEFVLLILLNYNDVADYHDTLIVTHGMCIMSLIPMFVSMARYFIANRRRSDMLRSSVIRVIGLAALGVMSTIDVIRFYTVDTPDRATFVRFGILIFIICFGVSSLGKTVQAVKAGAKAEVIRTLAYTDGLTGLGNRTAFNEKMDGIRASGEPVGVVMLDVNNLKTVNDGLGHEMGDLMLKKSSEFISASFEGSLCYRTGGDEFVVIIEKNDLEKRYLSGAEALLGFCGDHNASPERRFEINIAIGFCLSSPEMPVDDACKEADALMYKNKRIMKGIKTDG